MSRRRWLLLAAAVLVVVVLSAPFWLGYFGPTAAVYGRVWRPWRTHVAIERSEALTLDPSTRAMYTAQYRDPWSGEGASPGWQVRFIWVEQRSPLLPWVVTEMGTGP